MSLFLLALGLIARQHVDMNIALTAVNLLWRMGDHLASAAPPLPAAESGKGAGAGAAASPAPALTPIKAAPGTLGGGGALGAPGTAGGGGGGARRRGARVLTRGTYASLWHQLFLLLLGLSDGSDTMPLPRLARGEAAAAASGSEVAAAAAGAAEDAGDVGVAPLHLAEIPALAARPEVRNSAVSALFACLTAHGGSTSAAHFRALFLGRVMPLIEHLTTIAHINLAEDSVVVGELVGKKRGAAAADDDEGSGGGGGGAAGFASPRGGGGGARGGGGGALSGDAGGSGTVRLVLHHSRDTVGKQWNETRVIG
jgi:hypothetical protein